MALLCLAALPTDYTPDWSFTASSGVNVEGAWNRTLGHPDIKLAIASSGILWDEPDLLNQAALNLGELGASAKPHAKDGTACTGTGPLAGYDCNGDGVVTVADWANDPHLTPLVPDECFLHGDPAQAQSERMTGDVNRNCVLDPGDLVLLYSDGVDDDANGYTDDICGWDFFANDNDPFDSARSGVGTAQAKTIAAQANNGAGQPGVCAGCQLVPLRVADETVSESNDIAQAILYAADNKVRAIAVDTIAVDQTAFTTAALDYAYAKNVVVVAGMGDSNSSRHSMPATTNHVLDVAGVRYDGTDPAHATTFTNADGCSNSGPTLDVAISTLGCSRAAAAVATGIAGLVFSTAEDAKVTLSAEETMQLFRANADDIGAVGFDLQFGSGRANAGKILDAVAAQMIPPEVELSSPTWYQPINAETLVGPIQILGRAAAARATSYDLALQWAPGAAPVESDYHDIVARLNGIPATTISGGTTPLAQLDPDQIQTAGDDRTITIRVRATAHYLGGDIPGEARRVVAITNQKNGIDPDLLPGFPISLGTSVEASPKLADIDGDGIRDIVVPDSAGRLHVYTQQSGKPTEATGFPYFTRLIDGLNKDLTSEVTVPSYTAAPAYAAGAQTGIDPTIAREAVVQAPAIGDLDGDGKPEIVFASWTGTVYVVNAHGQDAPGWPKRLPLIASCPYTAANGTPDRCADPLHHWARGTASAPLLADLDNDGRPEIILGAFDGRLWVYDAAGTIRSGFPADLGPNRVMTTAAAVDLDSDGRPELVVGTNTGQIFAIDAHGKQVAPWPITIPSQSLVPVIGEGIVGSPVSADFDGDGRADIVLLGNGTPPSVVASNPAVTLPIGPGIGFLAFFGSAAIGDVDQDGVPDVVASGGGPELADVFADSSPTPRAAGHHVVASYSGKTGAILGTTTVEDYATNTDHAIADVSGDEYPEIITGTGGTLLHAADACGREAANWPKRTNGWIVGTAAVGDVNGDLGRSLEVVAGTRDGYLFAWTTKGSTSGKVLWESFHHDNANSGNVATLLAQGSSERAATPLTCVAAPATTHATFDLDGGCGCRAAGSPKRENAALFLLGLGVIGGFYRRRRRRN